MTLKNVTEAKQEDVTELWLWELYDGEDRKISDNQFHLKRYIEETLDGEITYQSCDRDLIFVFCKGNEIGVIKRIEVL